MAPLVNQAVDAEGAWAGSLSDGREYNLFVLDDKTTWLFYSPSAGVTTTRGIVQGQGVVSGASLSVTGAKDFDFVADTVTSASISASFVTATSISGNVTYTAPSGNFSIGSGSFAAVWLLNPDRSALNGTYAGATVKLIGTDDTASVVIAAGATASAPSTVTITLASNGCVITGSITPRPRGNAYTFTGTWGAAPCATPGVAFSGYGFLLLPASGLKQLTLWWTDAGRTNAWVISGARL